MKLLVSKAIRKAKVAMSFLSLLVFGGIVTPPARGQALSSGELLYSFANGIFSGVYDGNSPYDGVIMDGAGNLFGTTNGGGNSSVSDAAYGTIFELACLSYNPSTKTCAEYSSTDTLLYTFPQVVNDGNGPSAGLVMDEAGNLFGNTTRGGAGNVGMIFELPCTSFNTSTRSCKSYSSADKVLYSFNPNDDVNLPTTAMILDGAGNLFGTSSAAGVGFNAMGGIYELACTSYSTSAHTCEKYSSGDTILYTFNMGTTDGIEPWAALTMDGAGNLFGTTYGGGAAGSLDGVGTIFELPCTDYNASTKSCNSYSQTDKVLYSFDSGNDGNGPQASLIFDQVGNLYGTTVYGGPKKAGTVFKLACTSYDAAAHVCEDFASADTVLYRFTGSGGDGQQPEAALTLDAEGNLYGTTEYGGNGKSPSTSGTVFKLACESFSSSANSCTTYSTKDTVLLAFPYNQSDPLWQPVAGLILNGPNNLLGTTLNGGQYTLGAIFEVPTSQLSATLQISPQSLTFPATVIPNHSAAQKLTVKNIGTAAVNGFTATPPANFAITANNCGSTLAQGDSCELQVELRPTTAGSWKNLPLTINSSNAGKHTVLLTGTSVGQVLLGATSLIFPTTAIPNQSAEQPVTITNDTGVALTKISVTPPANFKVIKNNCPASLAERNSCTLQVVFDPTSVGAFTKVQLKIKDSFGTQTVVLTATGTGSVAANPASVTFAKTNVGSQSSKLITLTNYTGTALTIGKFSTSNAVFGINSNTCQKSPIAARASCSVKVTFAPRAHSATAITGNLIITDNFKGHTTPSPQTVLLRGTTN